ncbi:UDP-4-amino-4,6-dideoxy-N-acetyl-beta-L-altrosamine transaminase [Gracilibacillus caseinilyticus]|uniref:UDP-4-amino-4, 6-dideoxy-N-acetyl-beta-L-altrosamine transaminase n=1 Tax=Gracilibacillus caseinilyticus TaxID=2932256 RepID=A0ABY4EXD1_9BACI|nr:UDP-4-amino-4,6-dideoxy-N-acetyl-beta-L-altrosamine transaminase [Gracilibacillus caseinilyticus]UOQ48299.1 UDP-4-amino-4,6-dideoxy-N-acetyl-beta-L-altrosamine transaminase [Gracilibacillus caseinilyticus]
MSDMIPYGRQYIDKEDINAVISVLRGDFLTTGPSIEKFEDSVAKYVDAKYAVAFSSGTAALHGACYVAGINEGDEVITSPMTFAASSNCILYQKATPIFADIDKRTNNIDPVEIKKNISDYTKAIIPVDFTGQPCDLDEIVKIAKNHDLIIIEDAAHALGATYKNRKIGSISDMTMFSFHPVKHITTGEGGIITTNNREYYEKLLAFRSHGITRDRSKLSEDHGPWYYEMQFLGYNYRMTDLQAALGISQINKSDYFLKRRTEIANKYNQGFTNIPEVERPYRPEFNSNSWHLYVIRLRLEKLKVDRKTIFEELRNKSIGVNVHYIPVYYQPYYKELDYKKGICPNAESLYEEIISLPLFPSMTDADIKYVIETVKDTVLRFSIRG